MSMMQYFRGPRLSPQLPANFSTLPFNLNAQLNGKMKQISCVTVAYLNYVMNVDKEQSLFLQHLSMLARSESFISEQRSTGKIM